MKQEVIKFFSVLCILGGIGTGAFAQSMTAKQLAENAVSKANPDEAIKYLKAEVEKLEPGAEKRSTYAFLGSIQEAMALFEDAQKSYVSAVAIAAGDAEGMSKKSSEQLVIDAVRCALSAGEWESAASFLNSAVRNSKSSEILAKIKLYEQWCALCRAESYEQAIEPLAMLKAYLELPSMNSVKPNILLTLWYITGETVYSDMLTKEFPKSAEASIVTGKVQIYPAPFWYFVPKKK